MSRMTNCLWYRPGRIDPVDDAIRIPNLVSPLTGTRRCWFFQIGPDPPRWQRQQQLSIGARLPAGEGEAGEFGPSGLF